MEQQKINELVEKFLSTTESLPNPAHQPKQVEYLVKLFLYKENLLKSTK